VSDAATPSSTIAQVLEQARGQLERLRPERAAAELAQGAVLVDIRPQAQRAREGEIPGAWVIERNVLEWRFDPTSPARLPFATRHDLRLVVFCSEGYTSSLAAASLQQLGLHRATDLDGGFVAWEAAGLPTVTGGRASDS
jgi:rhodanese-related sulfurtransferase